MTDNKSVDEIVGATNRIHIKTILNNNQSESTEDPITTDSEEYLSEPLRYRNFQYSTESNNSGMTVVAQSMNGERDTNFFSNEFNLDNLEIPIVGYEIMEERARFTVYKLRIENKATGDCWYVFRRYTDFVRLCNRLKTSHSQVVKHLPRKRWLKNNFDPVFLEERVNGLQTLVNAILSEPDLINSQEIQDFFCLNEPPVYSETNEESRAIFEALEETITDLKLQLQEKDALLDTFQDKLHTTLLENDHLKQIIRKSTMNCQNCEKEFQNLSKIIK